MCLHNSIFEKRTNFNRICNNASFFCSFDFDDLLSFHNLFSVATLISAESRDVTDNEHNRQHNGF